MPKRFPFLGRYVKHPSVWNMYLEPVDVALAEKYPSIAGSWRCPCCVKIVLLDATGDEIGFVGQRTKIVPASRFLWWTKPAEAVEEQFPETVHRALQRFSKPTNWVLVLSEQGMVGGYNATMFFAPDGQSVNERLAQMLEDKRQAEEARLAEYDLREQQRVAETLAKQNNLLEEALGRTEV